MSRIRIIAIAAAGVLLVLLAVGGVALWSPWSSAAPADIHDLMARAHCDRVEVNTTQLYANATASCTANGDFVSFSTFDSVELRDKWVSAAAEFGGAPIVMGDTWVAMSEGGFTRQTIATALGGEQRALGGS